MNLPGPEVLTPTRLERYSRQMLLREVGGGGQVRLLSSGILLYLAPGWGKTLALSLTGMGMGRLALVGAEASLIAPLAELNPDTQVTRIPSGDPLPFVPELLLSLGEEGRGERVALARRLGVPLLALWRGSGADGWIGGYDPRQPEAGCPLCPLEDVPPAGCGAVPPLEAMGTGWMEMGLAGEAVRGLLGVGPGWSGRRWHLRLLDGAWNGHVQSRVPGCAGCADATTG